VPSDLLFLKDAKQQAAYEVLDLRRLKGVTLLYPHTKYTGVLWFSQLRRIRSYKDMPYGG
jgi:hypothetical protein